MDCSYNGMASLDVTKNTSLNELYCRYNSLVSLDVTKNTALEYLWCQYNSLASLDVTKNTALIELRCNYNNLASLDVTKNTALKILTCANNALTSLNVTGLPLTHMDCSGNYMSGKDKVTGFTGTWDGVDFFFFDTQYTGTPLKFMFDKDFIIPPTNGTIKSVNVSSGVSGGAGHTYALSNNPSTLAIHPTTGVISGTLADGEYGVMTVTVKAKDDSGAEISKSIRIAYGVTLAADDNGDNILLYVAIVAIVAIAIFVAYWFFLRPRKA
jgi:hypothetical protein